MLPRSLSRVRDLTGRLCFLCSCRALANVELKSDDLADEDLKKAKTLVPGDAAISNLIVKVAKRRSVFRALLPLELDRTKSKRARADLNLSLVGLWSSREERKVKERAAFGKMFA